MRFKRMLNEGTGTLHVFPLFRHTRTGKWYPSVRSICGLVDRWGEVSAATAAELLDARRCGLCERLLRAEQRSKVR